MTERDPEEIPTDDPRPDGLRRAPSLVQVNTGNGKGKTSAAMGVVIRGVGRGWPVGVVQFGDHVCRPGWQRDHGSAPTSGSFATPADVRRVVARLGRCGARVPA